MILCDHCNTKKDEDDIHKVLISGYYEIISEVMDLADGTPVDEWPAHLREWVEVICKTCWEDLDAEIRAMNDMEAIAPHVRMGDLPRLNA